MSYTATFDASHKVKRGGGHSTNFERHIARDVDAAAGFAFAQRNANIDPSRSHLNITAVNDGFGGFRKPVVTQDENGNPRPPSAEFSDYLESRLATVKRKIRSDAVVMRPLVLQLDPQWFAEHNPDWRTNGLNREAKRFTQAQLNWVKAEFGQENIVGFSVHLDEAHPQLQVMFTPVTPDGRLSQKDFFKGPSDLQRMHREHREHMRAHGYEASFEVTARSKEHLSSEEYARRADRATRGAVQVGIREINANVREKELDARQSALDEREGILAQREAEIPAKRRTAAREAERIVAEAKRRAAELQPEPDAWKAELRAQSPHIWSSYLAQQPKIAEHFDKWAWARHGLTRASQGTLPGSQQALLEPHDEHQKSTERSRRMRLDDLAEAMRESSREFGD